MAHLRTGGNNNICQAAAYHDKFSLHTNKIMLATYMNKLSVHEIKRMQKLHISLISSLKYQN